MTELTDKEKIDMLHKLLYLQGFVIQNTLNLIQANLPATAPFVAEVFKQWNEEEEKINNG